MGEQKAGQIVHREQELTSVGADLADGWRHPAAKARIVDQKMQARRGPFCIASAIRRTSAMEARSAGRNSALPPSALTLATRLSPRAIAAVHKNESAAAGQSFRHHAAYA